MIFRKNILKSILKRSCKGRERKKKNATQHLKEAYNNSLPLTKALYTDLLSLCKSEAIPKHYYGFYETLHVQTHQTRVKIVLKKKTKRKNNSFLIQS